MSIENPTNLVELIAKAHKDGQDEGAIIGINLAIKSIKETKDLLNLRARDEMVSQLIDASFTVYETLLNELIVNIRIKMQDKK